MNFLPRRMVSERKMSQENEFPGVKNPMRILAQEEYVLGRFHDRRIKSLMKKVLGESAHACGSKKIQEEKKVRKIK